MGMERYELCVHMALPFKDFLHLLSKKKLLYVCQSLDPTNELGVTPYTRVMNSVGLPFCWT